MSAHDDQRHLVGARGAGDRSTSFGRVAERYEAFRPGPPTAAVRWLFPDAVDLVVDVGAGTGALSRLLREVARQVVAVEPDPDMRQVLTASVPGIVVLDGRGEALPVADEVASGVVASSSWHWVEPVAGLTEAARVLHPGGVMAVLWSGPDPDGVFMRQAQAALAQPAPGQGGRDAVLRATVAGDLAPQIRTLEIPAGLPFGSVEHHRFSWVLPLTADQLIGLLGTLSWIIVMEEDDRQRLFDTARRLLRDVLGVADEVTVDVDFACEAYRATKLSQDLAPDRSVTRARLITLRDAGQRALHEVGDQGGASRWRLSPRSPVDRKVRESSCSGST
jgi:SAM-dependent methyltransferase